MRFAHEIPGMTKLTKKTWQQGVPSCQFLIEEGWQDLCGKPNMCLLLILS